MDKRKITKDDIKFVLRNGIIKELGGGILECSLYMRKMEDMLYVIYYMKSSVDVGIITTYYENH